MIDAPWDYNLLLGRSWTYTMCVITSAILQVVGFPHEGKFVTVDQLNFTRKGHLETNESTLTLIDQTKLDNNLDGNQIPPTYSTGSKQLSIVAVS